MGEFDATAFHSEKIELTIEFNRATRLGPRFSKLLFVFCAQSLGSIDSLSNAKTPNTHS
jgi:hypothetical protein